MEIRKFSSRAETLFSSFQDYKNDVRTLKSCDEDEILLVGVKITEDYAKSAAERVFSQPSLYFENANITAKMQKVTPVIHKEYYTSLATYFHVSRVDYTYMYYKDGNPIEMSPSPRGANIDISAFTETAAGRYHKDGYLNAHPKPMTDLEGLRTDELVSDFEPGFLAHGLTAIDVQKDSNESMKQLNGKLTKQLEDIVQNELGRARTLHNVTLLDRDYTYVEKVICVPYYVFTYDLGDQIATITVSAYSGQVSAITMDNPLSLASHARTMIKPKFSILLCVLASLAMIIVGGLLYTAYYLSQVMSYKKSFPVGIPNYTFEELKQLI